MMAWFWYSDFRNDGSIITIMVWVECGGCYTEIATAFSKPRNDGSFFRHCEQSEAIHKPLIFYLFTKK